MAIRDPSDPWAWAPPEWDQQFDPSAPLVGTIFDIPQAMVPPAPQMPAPRAPDPIPYDPNEGRDAGAGPASTWSNDGGWRNRGGGESFPPVAPAPRTDAARIGMGGPTTADEIAQAPRLTADEAAQIEIDPQQPSGLMTPPLIEMPDDFVGRPEIEMPDDYVGRGPELQPDAVSGGQVPGQETIGAHQTQGTPGEMPNEYLSDEELGQKWSTLSPEQQEMERGKIEGARQRMASARMLEQSEKTMRAAEDNARIYEQSVKAAAQRSAELDADAQNLARKNPLDSITGSQKVFGVLASIVGGFATNRTGRNMGLEIVDQIADAAAAQHAQKLQLNARQQAGIGDQMERADDAYKAAETVRLATYDGAIKSLESEVQNFDPRGTTALRVMDQINAMKARRAEILAKSRDEELKRTERMLKEQRELLQLQETQRHNIAGEKNDATKAYADLLRAKTDEKKAEADAGVTYSPEQLQQLYGAGADEVPPIPMNPKQYEKWLETKKKKGDVAKITQETSDEERNRQFGVGELVDDQGEPIKFRSAESAGKVATLKGAADFGVQLLDRLNTAYQLHGWSSDLIKSPEWQSAQADFNQYMLEKKNIDALGVLAGPDLGLIKGSMGAVDPTGIRDPGPGLARARANVVEKLNSTVRAEAALPKGRTPKAWDPPKPPPPPTKTPADKEFQEVLAFEAGDSDLVKDFGVDPQTPGYSQKTMKAVDALRANDGLTPVIKARIDRIRKASTDTTLSKEEREQAAANLAKLAADAESKAVRDYAAREDAFARSQAENLRDIAAGKGKE